MTNKQARHFKAMLMAGVVIILCGVGIYYAVLSSQDASAEISLMPNDASVTALGKQVYSANCAACHGGNLQGQANWRQRDSKGYMPAPPHNEKGHTWHHPDIYLFSMTKYGIEKVIGREYPNNMPAYEGKLSDEEIIAALSYIKSRWPQQVQQQHDQINARSNAQ